MIRSEIRPLTGIRGVAALAVLFHHFGQKFNLIIPSLAKVDVVRLNGNLGVDLFFILSGFIMTYVYAQHQVKFGPSAYRIFIIKRFARIYPNHLTALLLLLGMWTAAKLVGVTMEGNYSLRDFLLQLFLLSGYVRDNAWNYPNWSVSIEWFGYIAIFPLSILLTRLALIRRFPMFFSLALLAVNLATTPLVPYWFNTPWQITCQFLAGVFAFMAWERRGETGWIRLPLADIVAVMALALVAASFFRSTLIHEIRNLLICSFPLLLCGLANETGMLARWLATRTWVYLGTISYALYISHALIEKSFKVIAPVSKCASLPLAVRILIVLLHLLVPILFAMVLQRWVEEPGRKFLTKLFLPRPPKPSTT